jgi:parallel beta-helix repeat protein
MRLKPLLLTIVSLVAGIVAQAQSNLVLLVSQPGDYIGLGTSHITANPAEFTFTGTPALVVVGALGYIIAFAGPGESNLTVGTYTNAARWTTRGAAPGLEVTADFRGCSTICGGFQILELHTDASGNVDRFWAKFTQYCECSMPPLAGEVRYHSQLAPPAPTVARTLRVPADFPSIQAALTNTSPLAVDTVLVAPGIYHESVGFQGRIARVISSDGPAATLIAAPAGTAAASFNSGETADALLSGFTITNSAIGVSIGNSSPTITSNVIVNCGQGIVCGSANAVIRGNRIVGSHSTDIGFGVGSAIALGGAASPLLEGNIVESNDAGISMNSAGSPIIRNNVLQANRGNAIEMLNFTDADIIQNLILGNGGSGIWCTVAAGTRGPRVVNNTILENSVAGIYAAGPGATAQVINNIILGNPALVVGGFNDGSPPIFQNNDFYSASGAAYSGLITNLTGIAGNLSTDPWFACQPGGDFHLLAGSPCIDAGTNLPSVLPVTDFDGNPRILPGSTNGAGKVDLGAFEFNPALPPVPCLYIICPSNIVVSAPPGQNTAVVTYPKPEATRAVTVTSAPASGSVFPAGTNVVTCTASSGTNAVSCTFTVTVLVWPTITVQPQDTYLLAGQTLDLLVLAGGSAPLAYSWLFQGARIAGATNSTLTITNVQADRQGAYQAVVANSPGSITSRVAMVRVSPAAPQIVAWPALVSVPAGSNATFTVTSYGSAPMTARWLKDGSFLSQGTSTQLVLTNVQLPDAGAYQLILSNSLGTATSTVATLEVLPSPPTFVVQPTDATVLSGDDLGLRALARGSEPIAYQWRQNGVSIAGANQSLLTISSVTTAAVGAYDVLATNSFGAATSVVAQVSVNQWPLFQQELTNLIVDAGSTVALTVAVTGSGTPAYAWQWNGAPIPGAGPSLLLTNLQPSRSGYYRVTVTNPFGRIASTARLSVFGPTSRVVAWGDNSGGQTNVPANLDDAVAVAGGDFFSVALHRNGTLLAWGSNADGETDVPTDGVPLVAIAAGAGHTLALTEEGTVVAWGRNDSGQTVVPDGLASVISVAAGGGHSLALLVSGRVLAWGNNQFGQARVPASLTGVSAIAAGRHHSLALRADGTVVGWGQQTYGQATPPPGLSGVVGIGAGYLHSVALRADGTVLAWGDNSSGQTNVPAGLTNVIAIAAGDLHTLALRADGSVAAWGDNTLGQTVIPASVTGVIGIAAGYYHGLALLPATRRLHIHTAINSVVIEWSGSATLQWSPTVSGPFTDLPGVAGAYTNTDFSFPSKYFRLR